MKRNKLIEKSGRIKFGRKGIKKEGDNPLFFFCICLHYNKQAGAEVVPSSSLVEVEVEVGVEVRVEVEVELQTTFSKWVGGWVGGWRNGE